MSSNRDTSLRIPIIKHHLPTALSPSPAPASSAVSPRTLRSRQKSKLARNGIVTTEVPTPKDGLITLTQGMRDLNTSRDGSYQLCFKSSDTTRDAQKTRSLSQTSIEPATTAETNHITEKLIPRRQTINYFTSRCSFIAPSGIIFLSPRHSGTHTSSTSTDTSFVGSSSQAGFLEYLERASIDVFQAVPTVNPSPEQRTDYRVRLDNGVSIGCSMSSNSAYSMASASNSPAAGKVTEKGPDPRAKGKEPGVNKWRRIAAEEETDDIASDEVDMTPKAIRIRKRGEGLALQDSNDNIMTTPRRRSRPWGIYHPSPTKKAKLSSTHLPHPDIGAKENVKSSASSGLLTAPLVLRARAVSKPADPLPRRSDKGYLAEKFGLRNIAAFAAGISPLPRTEHRKVSSATAPRTRVASTNQAKCLIPPIVPLGSDINAAVDERFLQVRGEQVSCVCGLAGKVSPSLTGNVSMGSSGRSLVCEAGSSTSSRSWVTYNPDAKPVREVAGNSQPDTPILSDDDQLSTPLMDSLLLTPDGQPHNRLPEPQPTTQTRHIKPRLYGLGLDIFPEEPIQVPVPRRWDAGTWQQSFRRTADYDDALARFGAIEGKRQEAIWAFVKTEQQFVMDVQCLLSNVDVQIARMMATRYDHTRNNALRRIRSILVDTLKIHRSFLDKLSSLRHQQSPCAIAVAATITEEIPALLKGLPYLMNRNTITSIVGVDVERTVHTDDTGGKMLAVGKSLSTLEAPVGFLGYPALIKAILDSTLWSHPDRAASQILFRKIEDMAQRVQAVMAEEDLSDELFTGEFLLRNVPDDFHTTRKARRLVVHCDVAEISLLANSAGFQNRISRLRPPAGNQEPASVNKTGLSSANPLLLSHYHRDSLTTRGFHIFVFTDCVCFGHRTMNGKSLLPLSDNTNAETRETWHFDRAIGFLQLSSVHHTEYLDFPHVLVLQAKPPPRFEVTSSEATFATLSNAVTASILSLVPALHKDTKRWTQLGNALKATAALKHKNKPLEQPPASSLASERLDRSIAFWLDRMDDVADNVLSLKAQTQATYFL